MQPKDPDSLNFCIILLTSEGGFLTPYAVKSQKLDGGFSLWQRYMRRADQHIRALGEKAQVVKYEDFLANPYESLKSLLEFCGLKVSDEAISGVTKIVNISRAYAFQRDPELHAFANSKAKQLEIYGY